MNGIPNIFEAKQTGKGEYPPIPNTTNGFFLVSKKIDFISEKIIVNTDKILTKKFPLNIVAELFRINFKSLYFSKYLCPLLSVKISTEKPFFKKFFAKLYAGNTWPPVPPVVIKIFLFLSSLFKNLFL